jgi:hypothetical protein
VLPFVRPPAGAAFPHPAAAFAARPFIPPAAAAPPHPAAAARGASVHSPPPAPHLRIPSPPHVLRGRRPSASRRRVSPPAAPTRLEPQLDFAASAISWTWRCLSWPWPPARLCGDRLRLPGGHVP